MKTQTSRKSILVRSLLILPLLALLLYGFSTRETLQRSNGLLTSEIENSDILELSIDRDGKIFMGNREMTPAELGKLELNKYSTASITSLTGEATPEIMELFPVLRSIGIGTISLCSSKGSIKGDPQKLATPEEVAEYDRLVKYYNEIPKEKRVVKQEDANKIMALLGKMSPDQREKAEKINFDVPPPPPPGPVPTPAKTETIPSPPPPVEVKGYPSPAAPPAPPTKAKGELIPLPAPVVVQGYPAPPPPPTPIEAVQGWVEEGAAFFYNGKAISGKEAIEIVQKNNGKNLSVNVEENNSKKTVRLSDKM